MSNKTGQVRKGSRGLRFVWIPWTATGLKNKEVFFRFITARPLFGFGKITPVFSCSQSIPRLPPHSPSHPVLFPTLSPSSFLSSLSHPTKPHRIGPTAQNPWRQMACYSDCSTQSAIFLSFYATKLIRCHLPPMHAFTAGPNDAP